MLSQPLLAKGISARYITSGNPQIVDDLLAGDCKWLLPQLICYLTWDVVNENMLGVKTTEAGSDLAMVVKGKKKSKR
jgi:hypothetical protein